MKWSWIGRAALALTSAVSLGLSMTACGGGTIAYLWAVGSTSSGSGQVVGYKVDDFTGNLTASPGSPFASTDTNPIQVVVRPGGRFLYVINQGTGYTGVSGSGTGAGIDLYAIGGEGSLTYEQHYDTQGTKHLWATFDSTGSYLYVLDQYSPTYQSSQTKASYDANGAITAFTSDASTGRLNALQLTNFTLPGQAAPLYVEVGQTPLRMATNAGGCLFTLNSVGQTVTAYSISNGQLGTVTTGTFPVQSTRATSINGNGQYMFVTDDMGGNGASGQIRSYTVGSNCALTALNPGAVTVESAGATNPLNVFITTSSKYVYVLNANNENTTTTTQGSTISGYSITSGQLEELSGSPFPVGAGPACMVEDPTSKYLYTADSTDGTITGFDYPDPNGLIAPLIRGSRFTTTTNGLKCLAISGTV